MGASFIASAQWFASARAIAAWVAYALVFLACRRLRGRDTGAVTLAVVAGGTILALHGLYQTLIGFDAMPVTGDEPSALAARLASGRAVAGLGLPAALAGFLGLSLPLTLGFLTGQRSRGRRALAVAAAVTQAAGLAATRSAAGVVSLAAAGAVVLWWSASAERRPAARRLAFVTLVAGLTVATLFLATRLHGRASADEGAGPLALRAGNWKVAALILADHPTLGAGPGCYGIVFPRYRTWEMNESRFAHNSYLQVFAECGLPLGVTTLVLAGLLVARLKRLAGGEAAAGGVFLAISCLAFLIHNVADFTFFLPTVGFAFFALAGIAMRGDAPAGVAPRRSASFSRIACALALAAFAILATRADRALQTARAAVPGPVAETEARRAVAANAWDPEARSLLSNVLLEKGLAERDPGMLRASADEAQRAVELDPMTPHHWHDLGRVRLALQDPLGAYIAMQRAVELYPIRLEYRDDRDRVAAALRRPGKP